MHCLFGIIGELCFIVGIILNFWAFLSPTPWYSNDVTNSMLYFTPYNEPVGYVAPNPCGSAPLSNSTVSITYGAETNPINYGDVAVWMGPFGSCSRDEDGAVHCTKPSYSYPKFNMTYVQANSIFYPQNMPHMQGPGIFGLTVLHCILFSLYVLVSISYWFPLAVSRTFKDDKKGRLLCFACCVLIMIGLSGLSELYVTSTTGVDGDSVSSFNSIDNMYDPAPCGQTRKLKPGILLVAKTGKMYNIMWASWCLIYIIALPVLFIRVQWILSSYDKYVRAEVKKRTVRDVERAAAKEQKAKDTFRLKVEKEKERIRFTALAEIKAEEAKKSKEVEVLQITSTSTLVESESGDSALAK